MITQCLELLQTCDSTFREELKRLERLRTHELRRSSIPASATPFRGALPEASWTTPFSLPLLGRAAARPDTLTIIPDEETSLSELPPGCSVLVAGDTLDPVARSGQWVLLAEEDVPLADGDLAAVSTDNGGRLLRRVWSEGDEWVLQAINAVKPIPSITLRKLDTAVRKVIGVLYEPWRQPRSSETGSPGEWQPRADFDPGALEHLRAIAVEGGSLDPIARRGQLVLVGEKQALCDTTLERGGLAVIETADDAVGCVIKRVFPSGDQWILVSSNPVDPHEPIAVSVAQIVAVWPLRGVLFESRDAETT
jgi:SOS-response transcriptional repressor LexA